MDEKNYEQLREDCLNSFCDNIVKGSAKTLAEIFNYAFDKGFSLGEKIESSKDALEKLGDKTWEKVRSTFIANDAKMAIKSAIREAYELGLQNNTLTKL